jgi:hypothetical protein
MRSAVIDIPHSPFDFEAPGLIETSQYKQPVIYT